MNVKAAQATAISPDRAALSAPSAPARDRDAAARLWEVTERLIGPFLASPAAA
ncbi:hypothetical protein ACQP1W_44440 [Spirillospora sp. CA-255316]